MFESFRKEDESYKKVGPLEKDQGSQELLEPLRQEASEAESRVKEAKDAVEKAEDRERRADQALSGLLHKMEGSEVYQTPEGNLVASLPDRHPVIKAIEMRERIDQLEAGLKNVITALTQEKDVRVPIEWTQVEIPEGELRALIETNVGGRKLYNSWESRSEQPQEEITYVRQVLPDLFSDEQVPIRRVNFCHQYEGDEETGFSGIAVFTDARIFGDQYAREYKNASPLNEDVGPGKKTYDRCLVLVAKNGARYCVLNCNDYKTYPQMTKDGPDFAGYGKTSHGRFVLRNVVFSKKSSSGGYEPIMGRAETLESLTQASTDGRLIDGIDPNTYLDAKTRCIVMDKPFFIDQRM